MLRRNALNMGILPKFMCRALYTEFNMRDKDALVMDDRFLEDCMFDTWDNYERKSEVSLEQIAIEAPTWCTLTKIGSKLNRPRIVLRINRQPEEFLKCLNLLMRHAGVMSASAGNIKQ